VREVRDLWTQTIIDMEELAHTFQLPRFYRPEETPLSPYTV
jgi:hypothetical protein